MTHTLRAYLSRVASAFATLPHVPTHPCVYLAYGTLKLELWAQYQLLEPMLRFTFVDVDPYATSAQMFADIDSSARLAVYTEVALPVDHPFAALAPNGQTYNTIFRAVHDALAHYPGRHNFGALGEFRAFHAHCRLLSEYAQWAIATETLAQNAWFYFGPLSQLKSYAENKAGLLPWSLVNESFSIGG